MLLLFGVVLPVSEATVARGERDGEGSGPGGVPRCPVLSLPPHGARRGHAGSRSTPGRGVALASRCRRRRLPPAALLLLGALLGEGDLMKLIEVSWRPGGENQSCCLRVAVLAPAEVQTWKGPG